VRGNAEGWKAFPQHLILLAYLVAGRAGSGAGVVAVARMAGAASFPPLPFLAAGSSGDVDAAAAMARGAG
jgi:hypothetical protein